MNLLLTNGPKMTDAENGIRIAKPEIPLEILKWNESNDISSANLRNGCWQQAASQEAIIQDSSHNFNTADGVKMSDITAFEEIRL